MSSRADRGRLFMRWTGHAQGISYQPAVLGCMKNRAPLSNFTCQLHTLYCKEIPISSVFFAGLSRGMQLDRIWHLGQVLPGA